MSVPFLGAQSVIVGDDEAFTCADDPGEIDMGSAARGSITVREAAILTDLARGRCVLEIGTGTGFSAQSMITTARSVVSIDIDPYVIEYVFPRLFALGIECATEIPANRLFDLVFLEGNHSLSSVVADVERARKVSARGGVMVFHDLSFSGVESGLRQLNLLDAVERFGTPLGLGMLKLA